MATFTFLLIFASLFYSTEMQKKPVKPIVGALLNFDAMTRCVLGYTALNYNGYGCYCGRGGAGVPIDGIDTCCYYHDNCYELAVENKQCSSTIWEYIDLYSWSCVNKTVVCAEKSTPCEAALCKCDSDVVSCWGKYPKPPQKLKCTKQ